MIYSELGERVNKEDREALIELVNMAKRGDKDALTQLIICSKDNYIKLAYIYLHNKEDAKDAVASMTLKLFCNIGQLRDNMLFFTWSKTILVNECKRILKIRRRIAVLEIVSDDLTELSINNIDNYVFVMKYVDKLSPKLREVIQLHYFMDYNYETIAQVVGIPVGTVKSRISKALKKMRNWLGGIADEC